MEDPKDNIIDQYLMHQLDDESRHKFEQQLAADSDLAEAVELRRILVRGIRTQSRDQLKQRLQRIHQTHQSSSKPKSRGFLYILIAVGLIAAILLALFLLRPAPPEPAKLYATYYQPYQVTLGSRDLNSDSPQIAQVESLYQSGQYQAAKSLFESLLAADPSNGMLQLGLGICQLEEGQLEPATTTFQAIIDQNNPQFKDQGRWYLALTLIRSNQAEQAKSLLEQLAQDPDADHHRDAQTLLQELR
ncbi:MAG: tetratricopeptide repeat protein [Bacteroidota bacterium]